MINGRLRDGSRRTDHAKTYTEAFAEPVGLDLAILVDIKDAQGGEERRHRMTYLDLDPAFAEYKVFDELCD